MQNLSRSDVYKIQRLVDAFIVSFYSLFISGSEQISISSIAFPLWSWVFFLYLGFSSYTKLYDGTTKRFFQIFGQWVETWVYTSSALVMVLYLSKTSSMISRSSSLIWLSVSMIMTLIIQIIIYKRTWNPPLFSAQSKILFWGDYDDYEHFICTNKGTINNNDHNIAWFGNLEKRNKTPRNFKFYLGNYYQMIDWLKSNNPEIIVFNIDNENEDFILKLISRFGCTSSPILFTSKWFHRSMSFEPQRINFNSYLRIWGSGKSKIDEDSKRIFDIIFAGFSLLAISPLFLTVMVIIKLTSSGPVFFTQSRNGLNGKEFKMYKFRSMKVNNDESVVIQATKNDQRFTKVGKFIRRWSIDEIPQLINVLKGDMTIVGPRPHAIQHNEEYSRLIRGYMQRHSVKPGMTGLAQISGYRGETRELHDMERRVFEDLIYQNNWSIKGDLAIILETIIVLGSSKAF